MLVIYHCIADYHETELENNKHLLSHNFCSSGIQEHVTWVVWAQGFSHEVVVKMSARTVVSVSWQEAEKSTSKLTFVAFSNRLQFISTWAAPLASSDMAFPRVSDPRKRKREQVRESREHMRDGGLSSLPSLFIGSTGQFWYCMIRGYTRVGIPGDGYHWRSYWRLVTTISNCEFKCICP